MQYMFLFVIFLLNTLQMFIKANISVIWVENDNQVLNFLKLTQFNIKKQFYRNSFCLMHRIILDQ